MSPFLNQLKLSFKQLKNSFSCDFYYRIFNFCLILSKKFLESLRLWPLHAAQVVDSAEIWLKIVPSEKANM